VQHFVLHEALCVVQHILSGALEAQHVMLHEAHHVVLHEAQCVVLHIV
jgi:hypothetical protein